MEQIFLSPPQLQGNEERYLQEAIASNWIAPLGPFVDRFEEELCKLTGANHAVALSSGTAALHLGLLAVGVKPGDVVLCSDLTFVASANAIRYCGATPLFLESERQSWNINLDLLCDKLLQLQKEGVKPAAILPTHLYGMPCQMDELLAIATEWEIPIVEDAAEALGSRWKGHYCGTFGKVGALSFNGNKIATTSGGGALLTNDPELARRARHLSTQARLPSTDYQHDQIGYNYRLSNLLAAVGVAQLEQLPLKIERRRTLYGRYQTALSKLLQVEPQHEAAVAVSNRWLSSFLLPTEQLRDRIVRQLASDNIEARPCWRPMTQQPLYWEAGETHPVATELYRRGICLPSGIAPDTPEWERVIASIQKAI